MYLFTFQMSLPKLIFLPSVPQAIPVLLFSKRVLPHLHAHFPFTLCHPPLWDIKCPQDQLPPFPEMADEAVVFSTCSPICVAESMDWLMYTL